ncbi:MAG: amidohydrolase [Rhodospirillales bacterium 20-60-12]|nr:MAG: amidohydrolase [Rhodospirillales bacterium 20-60-12]HQT67629.1 M20 aminoacylase family protein [Acetobacteraceae bacterium]
MPDGFSDRLVGWRHYLHAHPEISRQERQTAAFVCDRLAEMGIPFESGIGGHGVVATLRRGGGNGSVGLRADMDALPIEETTGLSYASTHPGVMHACGHDGHTTSLLGAALLLRDDPSWRGTVHFVFQPAEEGFGGALAMIEDGLFERFPMQRIFGYHNWPGLEAGTVMLHEGPLMAAGERLLITVKGHAGHAAMPHLTRDPVLAAAHMIVALQSIVSRNTDPLEAAVVSICTLQGAQADNQIPSTAILGGTCRALRPEVMARTVKRIREICTGIARAMDMEVDIEIGRSVAATINHKAEADMAAAAAAGAGMRVRRDMLPTMGSEDFGWFLERIPGAYAWIGNGPAEAGKGLHNPGYNYNDAILPVAANFLAVSAKQALGEA